MKKLLALILATTAFQPLFARDIVSPYAKNSIKVELENNRELIRFSYCEDKAALDKCKLLGEGLYKIEDIELFKEKEKASLTLNTMTASLVLPAAGAALYFGCPTIVGCFPAVIFTMFGLSFLGDTYDNIKNRAKFHSTVISDTEVDISLKSSLVGAIKILKQCGTDKCRKNLTESIKKQVARDHALIENAAYTMNHLLLDMDVAVTENKPKLR